MLDIRAIGPRPGSVTKDPVLVLRDRYWALTLQRMAGGKSFAALERELCPHLHIRDRADGEGRVQPFSLSKVAVGARGLSQSPDGKPAKVTAAELKYPGSSHAFTSLLWQVLVHARDGRPLECPTLHVAEKVARRFGERHQRELNGSRTVNWAGVRRAGRITHIDALGLLLWICFPPSECQGLAPWAATYVPASVKRLSLWDPAFSLLRDEVVQQIVDRLPDAFPVGQPFGGRTFQSARGRLTAVPLIDLV